MTTPQPKLSGQLLLAIGCLAAGAAASLTVASATTGSVDDSPAWHVLYDSTPAVQAAGAATAVVVALLRMSGTTRLVTALIAVIILVSTIAGSTDESLLLGYATSILAGVVIGSLAGWSIAVAPQLGWAPGALAVGAIIGVVLREPLSDPFVIHLSGVEPSLPTSIQTVSTTLLLVSVVLASGLNPRVRPALSPAPRPDADLRSRRLIAAAGVSLAAMSVLFVWWYEATVGSGSASANEWYTGYAQVAIVLAAALLLGRRGGAILVVAAAWTVSRSGETNWVPDNSAWLVLAAIAVVAGAVLGHRFGRPILGIAVLAACSATYLLLSAPFTEIFSATVLFVAPGAAAFATAGVLRGARPAAALLTIALLGPAIWMFAPRSIFVVFGTVGDSRPETIDYAFVSPSLSVAAKVAIPMIVAIIACGIALSVIMRRGAADVDAPLVE